MQRGGSLDGSEPCRMGRCLTVSDLQPSFAWRRLCSSSGSARCVQLWAVNVQRGASPREQRGFGLSALGKQTPLLARGFNTDVLWTFYPTATAGDPSLRNLNLQASDFSRGRAFWPRGRQTSIATGHRITESQNSRGWKGPLWVI